LEHTGRTCHQAGHQAAYAYIFLFLTKTVSKPPKDRGDSQMKAFFLATLVPEDARRVCVWEGLIKLFRDMLRSTKVAG
jgi:hypothetical protein